LTLQKAKYMADPFTDTVRSISDLGKTKLQLDAEYRQELQLVYGSFIANASQYELSKRATPYDIWLGQIRRYFTHEQIMSGNYQMPEGKVLSFKETLGPVFHIIAGVIAYVPGFGTAAAFVLNAATSLAEGAPITDATLDAVKGALPGQPVSTMAFDATVAIARGEPIENIAIAALPLDDQTKEYIKVGARVMRGLADGQPVTSVALDEVYYQLPPEGQHTMTLARRAANGENVGNIALEESADYLKGAAQQQINQFVANVGYQELMKQVPESVRTAIDAANALAYAMRGQEGAPVGAAIVLGRGERTIDLPRNNALAKQGLSIANANFIVKTRRALRSYLPQAVTTDAWRRGFDIGTASAYGLTANNVALDTVRTSLGTIAAMNGFSAGRDLQFKLSSELVYAQAKTNKPSLAQIALETAFENATTDEGRYKMALALGRVKPANSPDRLRADAYAKTGQVLAAQNPAIAAARALNNDGDYRYGFDIGVAISQQATEQHDPPQGAAEIEHYQVRRSLNPLQGIVRTISAIKGFDTGSSLMFGMNKMRMQDAGMPADPNVAAGTAIATGLGGTVTSGAQRANVMQSVIANPDAKEGASSVLTPGIFTRILRFFGLG
jgi:hypothetical protein